VSPGFPLAAGLAARRGLVIWGQKSRSFLIRSSRHWLPEKGQPCWWDALLGPSVASNRGPNLWSRSVGGTGLGPPCSVASSGYKQQHHQRIVTVAD